MTIIDGKKISKDILNEISLEVEQRTNKGYKTPHLAAILVGDDGPSQTYVNSKINACKQVGFKSSLFKYDNNITEKKLLEEIGKINNDDDIDGFIVQLPLPNSINQENILNCVNPNKDVDGFHPLNYGKMTLGIDSFIPATPQGILELIKRYKIDLNGKKCLVIGRSQIVGRPISILLSQSKEFCNATVTLAHSRTLNLNELTLDADVIISAIGRPEFLTENMVKEGSIIIDVGISRVKDDNSNKGYKIVGDVDFKNVSKKTSFITPVPGGVGPMTIAMLLRNTLLACRKND
jgi:methylenetetrahydrofolate dehydrogenase (NADP+)/methenyltetrahydrofolate cyclohydrolase